MMYSVIYHVGNINSRNYQQDTYFMGVFDESVNFEKMCYEEINKYDDSNEYRCRKDSTSVNYYKDDDDDEYWYFIKIPVELNKIANDGDCYDVNDL